MNLVIPINVQALRVTPNDVSLVTKQTDLFAGATTAFQFLPWRGVNSDGSTTDYPGSVTKANVSANIDTPLAGNVAEQLEAGVHLHWALPSGLARGVQDRAGEITYPAVPNRWLVSRILQVNTTLQVKQWIIESDYLMTEAEYSSGSQSYYAQYHRKSIAIPVGWDVPPGFDPEANGGSAYYPPSRRMGRIFELNAWQPADDVSTTDLTKIRHLDAFTLPATNYMAPNQTLGPLTAMSSSGASFSAYYPDSSSVFGFYDNFSDIAFDLANVAFQVSYYVSGWHSRISQDPLQSLSFTTALNDALATNTAQQTNAQLQAAVVQSVYGWYYDAAQGSPERCVYSGQVVGLPWNTTGQNPQIPGAQPGFPKCYLAPSAHEDPSVRVSIGTSTTSALSAILKAEWLQTSTWAPSDDAAPQIAPEIEKHLEILLDALQLGLLQQIGSTVSFAELEQAVHQQSFGSVQGGMLWLIRPKQNDPVPGTDSGKHVATLPQDSNDLAGKLDRLNACQQRMNALLDVIESCQRQIFIDWYKYVTGLFSPDDLHADMNTYIAQQILDLWAKFEAAFGKYSDGTPATNNLPIFYSSPTRYIDVNNGQYITSSPVSSLAGQIVQQANVLLNLLNSAYPLFELQQTQAARFWQPREPVVMITGDTLQPAQRNGISDYLPCRLSAEVISQLTVNRTTVTGSSLRNSLSLMLPTPADPTTQDAQALAPVIHDLTALLGEACLLDPSLAAVLAARVSAEASALQPAMQSLITKMHKLWTDGVPDGAALPIPGVLTNPSETVNTDTALWHGQAPQGLGVTFQTAWQDPFLPLFLVWTASFTPFQKGIGQTAANYGTAFLTQQFALDENAIELGFGSSAPQPEAASVSFSGSILLSSKAGKPLIQQMKDYLQSYPNQNPDLQNVIDYMEDKPLLSQGLSGINSIMQTLHTGIQLNPFNPFYDVETIPQQLVTSYDNFLYRNSLTNFVSWAAGPQTDHMPAGAATVYSLLRTGYLDITRVELVDVFGRKRSVISPQLPDDLKKTVVSWQLQPPVARSGHQAYLAPRIAQPSRLNLRWLSAKDDNVELNAHPDTSPLCGWIVPNHVDNSLMLFTGDGVPVGSLGVFGGQQVVGWQSVAGHPAQPIDADLTGVNHHLVKVAKFIYGQSNAFFQDLMNAIDSAHTSILPDNTEASQALAVLMGQPLAVLRASIRLEVMGLPAFDTGNAAYASLLPAQHDQPYDWTQRSSANVLNVDFAIRLGDRHHLEDGLVAYLLDREDPFEAIYAPAATNTGSVGVVQPTPTTLTATLNPELDPPASRYPDRPSQVKDLLNCTQTPRQTTVTILMDPRAQVHASMGVLPVKSIDVPPDMYADALRNIEVTFFTHPVLRGAQSLQIPVPDESGYVWNWTTSIIRGDSEVPHSEALSPMQVGDQAQFSYSPQIVEDGWLKLKPAPADPSH